MTAQIMGGKRILLVDDEDARRDALRMILKYLSDEDTSIIKNHSCAEAASGTEALKMLRGEHYDLVITGGYPFGEMRGDALVRLIKQSSPSLPVVLIDPFALGLDRATCAADVILEVPWQISELKDAVLELLATTR